MEPTRRNTAGERLESGELAVGVGIRQSLTVDIASIVKACDYDWLFLDLVVCFLLDNIHGLFYDTRIFGSVNSLTSR